MTYRPATTLLHGALDRTAHGETSEAVFLTSGFVYDDAEQAEATFAGRVTHYQYSRFGNPTVAAFERRLALLEGAEACRATATGMAAVNATMLSHLRAGDRVVASRALFGSCHWIVSTLLPRLGIAHEFVDAGDIEGWRRALAAPANLVLIETPSNPMLEIVDLAAVSELAHAAGALVVVDNVFATPLLQKPLALGADVVVYSATKHIDGQGRVLGGAVLGGRTWIEDTLQPFIRNTGPALSPFNAWTLLKGMETLSLRVDAMCVRARTLADFLAEAGQVSRVWYPGRADHPQHALAMRQMTAGGTLVTFELAGGKAAAFRFCNALRLIAISNNLGDSRSMVTHPATTTHMRIGAEERARLGITDGVVRLSVGLEDVADLQDDLARGLMAASLRQAAEVAWPRSMPETSEYAEVTRDITVRVAAFYLEDQSEPDESRYVWAYRVTIENRGARTVQLLGRTWRITDSRGRTFLVEGEGVVGEQPVLEPGEAFEYTSGTPLETPSGFMVGHYHMVAHGAGPAVAQSLDGGEAFDVAIPAFSLDSPHAPGRVH